jgi:hypothetical protein
MLGKVSISPMSNAVRQLYLRFLGSSNPRIVRAALSELGKKAATVNDFAVTGFRDILLEYIFGISQPKQLLPALALFCQCVTDSSDCLQVAAQSAPLHQVLTQHSHHAYAVVLGHPDAFAFANLEAELKWWMEVGNREYLAVYDKAVEIGFDPECSSDGFPSIVFNGGFPLVPPHLFGQLAKTEYGFQNLVPYLSQLFGECKSGDLAVRRAAFFALAQFASSPLATEYVSQSGIIELLIESALEMKSLMLRGTLLSCLSLISVSLHVVSILQPRGFQLFKFGEHSCVVPIDPRTLVVPIKARPIRQPAPSQPPNRYCELACQMLNPIHRSSALKEMSAAAKGELETVENSFYVQNLLGNYAFLPEPRQFLTSTFRQVPAFGPLEVVRNARADAEAMARLIEAQAQAANGYGAADLVFSTLPIPVIGIRDIPTHRSGSPVPEVYLTDAEFAAVTRMDKPTFYRLADGDMKRIRSMILPM